jgi:hypothetical protein
MEQSEGERLDLKGRRIIYVYLINLEIKKI